MTDSTATSHGRGRLLWGCVLLILSIVPWVVAPFIPLLLPTSQVAGVIAALLIGAEIIGVAAIAVLGKEAYSRITRRFRRSKNTALGVSQSAEPRSDPHESTARNE